MNPSGRCAVFLLTLMAGGAFPALAGDSSGDPLEGLTATQRSMANACFADTWSDESDVTPAAAMRSCVEKLELDGAVGDSVPPPSAEELRAIDAGGHFYLGGVTDVGSELLLHPDGRFEWVMMYGAVNRYASGAWHRDDGFVVLETKTDGLDEPARLAGFFPWNEAAERLLVAYQREQRRREVVERCPFVAVPGYASSAPVAGADKPSQAELMDRATRSADELKAAAVAVEVAARDFVKAGTDERPAAAAAATEAMHKYQSALAAAKDAHSDAGVDLEHVQLDLPVECRLPQPPDDERFDDQASWQGGVAVRVGDTESKAFFSGFSVALKFSDGKVVHGVTNRSGWLVRPGQSARLSGIEVGFPKGIDVPAFEMDVPPDQAGSIAVVDIDLSMLRQPAFETMRLRIDGGDLIPVSPSGQERGRYHR